MEVIILLLLSVQMDIESIKSRIDDYKNDVLCFVFIRIGKIDSYDFL